MKFRQCTGVWYIDNIASLMSLLKGRSDNEDLDHMSQLIHLLLFHLQCSLWFEWIQSKSNWSDGISRTGFQDLFVRQFNFRCHTTTVVELLWHLPLFAVSRVFQLHVMLWGILRGMHWVPAAWNAPYVNDPCEPGP